MWYVWATEPPQKLQLSTLCVEKKNKIKSAVKVSWRSAAYPESPTSTEKLMWNHLLYAMCLPRFALFFNLFFCLLLAYTLVINTLAHTQTHTSGCPSLWKEPAGSSFFCPRFLCCFCFTYCRILDIKPGASFSLRLSSAYPSFSKSIL